MARATPASYEALTCVTWPSFSANKMVANGANFALVTRRTPCPNGRTAPEIVSLRLDRRPYVVNPARKRKQETLSTYRPQTTPRRALTSITALPKRPEGDSTNSRMAAL